MNAKEYIGMRIRELRRKRHMSVEELGNLVGYRGSTVNSWERGRTEPTGQTLVRICKIFGVDIAYFYQASAPSSWTAVDEAEFGILSSYRALNNAGKEKLAGYADDLISSGKYSKSLGDSDSVSA